MSIRKHWGEENGQTVGVSRSMCNFTYIRGYNKDNQTTKIYVLDEDVLELVEALLDVRRRNNGKV